MTSVPERTSVLDSLSLSNLNFYWAAQTVALLHRLGLQQAVISPGSRSAPLAFSFARHAGIECIPVLDERSAGFFALGLAKQRNHPVVLLATSGTACANYYPALIEARYSHVPLLIFTADRPHELRECHSGQTINQVGLYAEYPRFQAEVPYPASGQEAATQLAELLRRAWVRSQGNDAGPVHLNFPFRDPLHPAIDGDPVHLDFDLHGFLGRFGPAEDPSGPLPELPGAPDVRGLIVAGPADPPDPDRYCRSVGRISRALGWPVLAEALSPLRNFTVEIPYLISGYDFLLRDDSFASSHRPDRVLQLGSLPTSKVLRAWLEDNPVPTWILDPSSDRRDPLNRPAKYLRCQVERYENLEATWPCREEWIESWTTAEGRARQSLERCSLSCEPMFEGKIPRAIARAAAPRTSIFFGNSMPVRDAEYFWPTNDKHFRIHCNRGANGIDGILSTAMGVAHRGNPTILVIGDLSLLHDSNGFLLGAELAGTLTVVLVQNRGGAIFDHLPISAHGDLYRRFFRTPQAVSADRLCRLHDVPWTRAETWEEFHQLLCRRPDQPGLRVIEVETNPERDIPLRKAWLQGDYPPLCQ